MTLGFKVRFVYLLAGALCLLAWMLTGVVSWPQPKVIGSDINLLGFTYALGQPQLAVFSVTNRSRSRVSLITFEPQVRTKEGWSSATIWGSPPMHFRLDAEQGTNITVAVPNVEKVWRLDIDWRYDPSTLECYINRGRNLFRAAKEGSLSDWKKGFAIPDYTNFSIVVKMMKTEQNGAANGSQPIRAVANQTSSAAGSRR